ncbi:MAG: response regulator transcription factor [Actinobacteria bacterium]|nr:response regulator transcription factor [Actinomycetota bacterium]MBI3688507.1 response regulator transcription factor [Actinomycetota bacterium]
MERHARVLIVDDDPTVSDVTRRYLERAGMTVEVVADGESALSRALADPPDLVVLDLMLPGMSGLDVCRQLRAVHATAPIVMLTALGEESDRVLGLELGADDYVTKPFSPRELTLRVKSVLRRTHAAPAAPEIRRDGGLEVDPVARIARLDGVELALTVREFELLTFLMSNPGRAYSRAELLEKVWGWTFGDQSTVTVHVRRLREKVERSPAQPRRLVTVWGVGYRFDPVAS